MVDKLEKIALLREILNDPKELIKHFGDGELEDLQHLGKGLVDIAQDIMDEREQKRKEEQMKNSNVTDGESALSDFTTHKLDREYKSPPITLNPLPDEERDKDWERIIGEKLYKLSDMIKKVGDDITKKGYLTDDPSLRQSIALGTDAFIEYINPLFDDKFIGDWRDLFNEIVKRYMHDHNLMEEPEFIRQYRYELDLETGNVKSLHKFSNKYYLGGNIIERINAVIKISDCIPFFAALFENNRQVRYKQQVKRDSEKRTE